MTTLRADRLPARASTRRPRAGRLPRDELAQPLGAALELVERHARPGAARASSSARSASRAARSAPTITRVPSSRVAERRRAAAARRRPARSRSRRAPALARRSRPARCSSVACAAPVIAASGSASISRSVGAVRERAAASSDADELAAEIDGVRRPARRSSSLGVEMIRRRRAWPARRATARAASSRSSPGAMLRRRSRRSAALRAASPSRAMPSGCA